MDPIIQFAVTGPPVAKGRPRIGRSANGRPVAYTPAATRKYEVFVKLTAQHAMGANPLLRGPLTVRMLILLSIPKSMSKKNRALALGDNLRPITRPDVDNYAKSILDALNGIVFKDDSQVVELRVEKRYTEKPRIEVSIFPFYSLWPGRA